MRVGDSYKIKSLLKGGASEADILKRFKNCYPEEEIKRFMPKKPVQKKAAKKKVATKKAED